MNVIASYRPAGFIQHLHKFGIYPTIVTHRWELDENQRWIIHNINDEVKIEKDNKHQIIRIPHYRTFQGKVNRLLEKYFISRQFIILFRWLMGYLDPGVEQIDSYISYKKFLIEHLKSNKYDMMVGIYSPHHHIRLCYKLNKRFKIPFFIDFRDVWPDNRIAHINYEPNFYEGIQDFINQYYWKKWMSKASYFTITSNPWKNVLKKIVCKNGFVITNAYDNNLFININKIEKDFFYISHIGTLYPSQDIESLFKAIKLVLEKNNKFRIKLNLIGVKSNMENRLKKGIIKYNLGKITSIEKRIPRDKALELIYNSDILYYPTWPNIPGTYSGKIFEYLASKNKILAFPNDNSVISKLLHETKSGVILNSTSEIIKYINFEYSKWNRVKNTNQKWGNKNCIKKYSRENQTKCLSDIIKDEING